MIRLYLVLPLTTYAVPTLLMGFSFTVLQRAVQDDPETSGRKVGLLQAANIAGNVAGSLVVGLLALNLFGTTGSMRALVIGGVVFAFLGIRHYGIRSIFGLAAAALLVLVVLISRTTAKPGLEAFKTRSVTTAPLSSRTDTNCRWPRASFGRSGELT